MAIEQPGTRDRCGRKTRISALILALSFYFLVAFSGRPAIVLAIVDSQDLLSLLALALLLHLAYRGIGWYAAPIALAVTLGLFAFGLASFWTDGRSHDVVIGGLLPWSDASGYYQGAVLLTEGGTLSVWNGRRPLFMSLLAVLFALTDGNLQWSIAILGFIAATASFLLARAIQATHGPAAAATALLVVYLFYSRFIATTMSEQLGFSLGALALAVLWQGAHEPQLGFRWYTGLWLLTIALAARAGAFFVLPAVVLWAALHSFPLISWRESLRAVLLGTLAIAAGFAVDAILREVLVPGAVPFSNFSYTLYGVAVGNKGYARVLVDHPQLAHLGSTEAAQRIYRLAFEAIRGDPTTAISGVLATWRQFFQLPGPYFLCYVPVQGLRLLGVFLSICGLIYCLRYRRDKPFSMLLAMLAGMVASVPFVPPIDADRMRAYAATIPLVALLLATGVTVFRRQPRENVVFPSTAAGVATVFGVTLVVVLFCGAIALKLVTKPVKYAPLPCPFGQERLVLRNRQDSAFHVGNGRGLMGIPLAEFKVGIRIFRKPYPELYSELSKIRPNQELRFAVNLSEDRYGSPFWLASDAGLIPPAKTVSVCAVLSGVAHQHRFYHARSFQAVN